MTNGIKADQNSIFYAGGSRKPECAESDNKNIGGVLADEGSKTRLPVQPLSASKPLMAAAIGKETK